MGGTERLPPDAWTGVISQDGEPADDTFVADLGPNRWPSRHSAINVALWTQSP